MLYTLVLSSVKTKLVFRSSSRRPSRISVVGWAAMVSMIDANYVCKKSEQSGSCRIFVTYLLHVVRQPHILINDLLLLR